jgi:hypothetical protein
MYKALSHKVAARRSCPTNEGIIRGAMDAAQVEDLLQKLAEIVFSIDKDLAEMKVSIAVLKAISATQLRSDDPKAGIEHIETLEADPRKADPAAAQRQKLADVIDAVKLTKKHGSYET